MPRFSKYDVDFDIDVTLLDEDVDEDDIDVSVDISVDEFLSECNSSEIKETIEWLKDNEHLKDIYISDSNSIPHETFLNEVDKIVKNYYMLTNEEQALIEKIAKRF
jgi:hypothetical protein